MNLEFLCDEYVSEGRVRPHLICLPYSIQNLHWMARVLNIHRAYFHHDHYDIPMNRIKEIMGKCRIVTTREIIRICRGQKRTNQLDLI